jgi:endonuclease YncB( thermonuclease family)
VLKKIAILLVALWIIGTIFGGEDEPAETAGKVTEGLTAKAGAEEPSGEPVEAEPTEEPTDEALEEPAKDSTPATTSSTPARKSSPEQAASPKPKKKPARPTYLVTRVIDGDTIELRNGEAVRFVGIDTPERGECGYAEATANMERLVLGKRVRLTMSDEDRDKYDRLLRYVDVGRKDAGLNQINRGFAIARYDSRDGYGYHPRENKYIAADKATPDFQCTPAPKPNPHPAPEQQSAYYENCTAAREAGAAPVYRGDPGYGSHLDRDGDGVACE